VTADDACARLGCTPPKTIVPQGIFKGGGKAYGSSLFREDRAFVVVEGEI
jgi:hypothetical protein